MTVHRGLLAKHTVLVRVLIMVGFTALIVLIHVRLTAGGYQAVLRLNPWEVLTIFIQLFAILDPVAAIPMFLSLTSSLELSERRGVVKTVAVMVMALMIVFTLIGQAILDALRVSVDSFKFGGGILLMVLAIDTLAGPKRTKSLEREEVAVVPITTPLLVGPGTMTLLIVLAATKSILEVLAGCLLVSITTYLLLRFSSEIMEALGPNVVRTIGKLTSVIIAAFAAEMIHAALIAWGMAR